MFRRSSPLNTVLILFVIGACLYGCLCYRLPLLDDSYICLQYARNLARGEGLVYNPGEYVEGYTTLSWVLLLSVAYPLGLDAEAFASWLGVLCTLVCVVVVWLLAKREEDLPLLCLVAPILAATNTYLLYWAGKGMETPLFTLLVTGGALSLAGRFDSGTASPRVGTAKQSAWAIWFGLAAVTRPEGVLYGLFSWTVWALWSWRKSLPWKQVAISLLLVLGPALAQLVWRIGYYGDILPNTFYAKMDANSSFYLRGVLYVIQGMYAIPLLALALLFSTILPHRLCPSSRFLLGFTWIGLGSIVLMGGDHFRGLRMLVPFVPVLCVLTQEWVGLAVRGARRFVSDPLRLAPILLLLLFARLWYAVSHDFMREYNSSLVFDMEERRIFGEWVAKHTQPGDLIATGASGRIPYVADRPNIDCLGLTDRHIAHLEIELGKGYPGHEKGDGLYVLSRNPKLIIVDHKFAPKAYYTRDFKRFFWNRSGMEFLHMPELDERYTLRVEKTENGFIHAYERRPGEFPEIVRKEGDEANRYLADPERSWEWSGLLLPLPPPDAIPPD